MGAVWEGLESLIGQSLLVRQEAAGGWGTRLSMLEMIREYAIERLGDGGELEALKARHAAYYLRFAESIESALRGPR